MRHKQTKPHCGPHFSTMQVVFVYFVFKMQTQLGFFFESLNIKWIEFTAQVWLHGKNVNKYDWNNTDITSLISVFKDCCYTSYCKKGTNDVHLVSVIIDIDILALYLQGHRKSLCSREGIKQINNCLFKVLENIKIMFMLIFWQFVHINKLKCKREKSTYNCL